jgi:hypothetical protein
MLLVCRRSSSTPARAIATVAPQIAATGRPVPTISPISFSSCARG